MLKYPRSDVNLKRSFFLSAALPLRCEQLQLAGRATSKSSRSRIRATLMACLFKNLHLKAKIKTAAGLMTVCIHS